jgi:hypothetical protein
MPVWILMLHSLLLQDSVALRLLLPPRAVAGEPVPIVLRLTNTTAQPLTLALQGRPIAYDIILTREDGSVVWRRLEGEVVAAILAVRELGPAESLEFQATWDGRDRSGKTAAPGRYLVTGVVPTDEPEGLRTRPASLTVVAPSAGPSR